MRVQAALLLGGAVLAACVAPPATPAAPSPPTRPAGSVLLLPPAPARSTPLPQPTASPSPVPTSPVPTPVSGPRIFAAAFSAASATRYEAWTWLAAMFREPPPAGLATAHEEALQRYLLQVRQLQAPPQALTGLRALQQRAEQDVAAQREAQRLIVHYWQTLREEDLVLARLARERAAAANVEAMRIAQALTMVLP